MRTIVYWDLYWGPPTLGNYHMWGIEFLSQNARHFQLPLSSTTMLGWPLELRNACLGFRV